MTTTRLLTAGALLLALAGCERLPAPLGPIAPTQSVDYSAIGHDPFWLATIGDDRIVLTLGGEGGAADGAVDSYDFPRVLAEDGPIVRRWRSSAGGQSIAIEARAAACIAQGRSYPDSVRVTLGARTLSGCGGRERGARG